MKRRGFLRMLGAAVAAPMMPAVGASAGASGTSYGLAIAHANRFPLVSATGMSKHIGVSQGQAEALLRQMSSEGLLGKLNLTRPGTVRASSKIFVNDVWGVKRTAETRSTQAERQQRTAKSPADPPKVSAMFAHLHQVCARNGFPLSARCFGGVHA